MSGVGGIELAQRYELAAALCRGRRVLDVGDTAPAAREPLASAAAELVVWDGSPVQGNFDAVVRLAGERGIEEVERLAGEGAAALVAFELAGAKRRSPRADLPPHQAARALADRLSGATVVPQFAVEGSLIGGLDATPELRLHRNGAGDEDAAALIVASGFDAQELERATAALRVAAAPALLSYVRGLEAAHAELLRANRELMRERVGREGSAAASLLNAQRELEKMRVIAREHEAQVRRVEAWYDAPRYHLVDRIRAGLTRIPGLTGFVRFLWSLVSTRAESPQLDAAANPEPDETEAAKQVTKEREGMSEEDEAMEPAELRSRLEG